MIDLEHILSMARDKVQNYIAPGLCSYIIGAKHAGGCVRLFHSTRAQQFAITPHSHRFDFQCIVLRGSVVNRKWRESESQTFGDEFAITELHCDGMGDYARGCCEVKRMFHLDESFSTGQQYAMKADEIHSIYFGADTYVLFFEGPIVSETSVIMEPFVDGRAVPTFEVKPWMFKKETPCAATPSP